MGEWTNIENGSSLFTFLPDDALALAFAFARLLVPLVVADYT